MTTPTIEAQIKASALTNGVYLNGNGLAYLFKSGRGKLHAVADTELEDTVHPKRYERLWNVCQGRAFATDTMQGWGWADFGDLEHVADELCKTCHKALEVAL